jgi:hypothetical protein
MVGPRRLSSQPFADHNSDRKSQSRPDQQTVADTQSPGLDDYSKFGENSGTDRSKTGGRPFAKQRLNFGIEIRMVRLSNSIRQQQAQD